MTMTLIFDVIATVGLGLALLLVFKIQKNLLGHPSRFFLSLFLGIYLLVSISNILRDGGIFTSLERYEYFVELFFPPIFLFFVFPIFSLYIFSTYMKQDFEKRLQVEQQLKESEARFRNLFENSTDGIAISSDNAIVDANQAFLDLYGYAELEEIKKIPFWFPTAQESRVLSPINTVDIDGIDQDQNRFECKITRKDGLERDVEVSSGAVPIGDEIFTLSTFRDITEKKKVLQAIKRTKDEWVRTFDTVPDHIAILDENGCFLQVNKKLAEHLKIPPMELIGKSFDEIVHGNTDSSGAGPLNGLQALNGNTVEIYEKRPNGHYSVSITPLVDEAGQNIGIIRVAHDITELKRIENELESTRAFLQSIIDGVTESIMVITLDHNVLLANRTACGLHSIHLPITDPIFCYQVSHHRGEPCEGAEHPCPLQATLDSNKPVTMIHSHSKPDGSNYRVELTASPLHDAEGNIIGIIEVGRDITEKLLLQQKQKKFEERLFQQQKAQSIATLAKGVAHDFNNMLGTVLGNVELLQMGSTSLEEQCGIIEEIGSAAQKMTDLTRQLMAYAKEGTYRQEFLVLNTLIHEAIKISRRREASAINVKLQLDENLWPVIADPGQMSQMLINIFTNAFEAMETKGSLTVVSQNTVKDSDWDCVAGYTHLRGEYVRIDISDTGPGISQDVADSLFEPFVTTKFLGRGLGLAAASGIAHNHKGCIAETSISGNGASFTIMLPRARTRDDAAIV